MHQGHREAALGRIRLQERQIRLEREILMSRSIGAAPLGTAGMNRISMECPGAGVTCGIQGWRACSGKDASFSGKPRNPDESLHVHNIYLAYWACLLKTTQCRQQRAARIQIITNATIINPNTPTAMIVFVVVSIVTSGRPRVTAECLAWPAIHCSPVIRHGGLSGRFLKLTADRRGHFRGKLRRSAP
jgi:hypothetical protein